MKPQAKSRAFRIGQIGLALGVLLSAGCASVVRSFIDTQPSVDISADRYADPAGIVGGHAIVYTLDSNPSVQGRQMSELARYAPVLIQGIEGPRLDYPLDSDEIGTPALAPDGHSGYRVNIDTTQPRVYATIEHQQVLGHSLTQLVYVFWYPRHPEGIVEQGAVDGGVLRITLDAAGRPAVYEYAQTCGCFHGVFVGEEVESWATQAFATRVPGTRFFSERKVSGKKNWVVREIVPQSDASRRLVVFIQAGTHQSLALQTTAQVTHWQQLPQQHYALAPYTALTHLRVAGDPDARVSMFNAQGLVWGGERKGESRIFGDLDHPGWPRRLSRMKINWDQADFTDTGLLDTFLRLPPQITNAAARRTALVATAPSLEQVTEPQRIAQFRSSGKPTAVLFTHELCLACQKVARDVLPDPRVHAAEQGWNWVVAEMSTAEGMGLADYYRVDFGPTLVLLDVHAHETRRIEGIASVGQFQAALETPRNDARISQQALSLPIRGAGL